MNEALISATKDFISDLFQTVGGSHDAEHTLRVYHNAMRLADSEPECDKELVALAALLHDVDDYKLFTTENNANARGFLKSMKVPAERIDRICGIIENVSFSKSRDKKLKDIESMIVQDADRLDAMGAVGVARTFAFGGEHGRSLEDSIRHFHEKLLLLKDLMNTTMGKSLAEERHQFLVQFLESYNRETSS